MYQCSNHCTYIHSTQMLLNEKESVTSRSHAHSFIVCNNICMLTIMNNVSLASLYQCFNVPVAFGHSAISIIVMYVTKYWISTYTSPLTNNHNPEFSYIQSIPYTAQPVNQFNTNIHYHTHYTALITAQQLLHLEEHRNIIILHAPLFSANQ